MDGDAQSGYLGQYQREALSGGSSATQCQEDCHHCHGNNAQCGNACC
jgi:hypothetical protein